VPSGFRHSKRFTLQDFHEPIRITPENRMILDENCVRCHAELLIEITEPHARDGGVTLRDLSRSGGPRAHGLRESIPR
jgi:hypothetical protein